MAGNSTPLASPEFRAGLDAAPDAMLVVNTDGVIDFVNVQAGQLFGYSQDELLGQRVEILLPERYRKSHVAHRNAFFSAPRRRAMGEGLSLFARKKNGEEFPIDVSLSDMVWGKAPLAVAAIRDITIQKQANDALLAAKEEAERATLSKSRFLAAASHDLRQPLQSLGLYLAVLTRQLGQPEQLEVGRKMRQSLDTMAELQDALLDISKLVGGSITPEKRDVPVREMLERIVTDNIQQAQEKGLLLECTSEECVVHTDRALLERVIENFVTNAIRYTERGRVAIGCQRGSDSARIEVSDTGIGIPKKELDNIFDEYYQLDNAARTRGKGLGLGLAIAREIAGLLGHPLSVTSVPGEGSTFAIDMPLGKLTQQAVKKPPPRETPTQRARPPIVLLVDDDAAIIDALTLLFEVVNFKTHSAINGDDALAHINQGIRPDVVVSDYRLPGDNGIEVVRRLRQACGEELPAILLTGDTSGQEIKAAALARCIVMRKPVDADQLVAKIVSLPER
jgi:PAS domain S-box-containing protein